MKYFIQIGSERDRQAYSPHRRLSLSTARMSWPARWVLTPRTKSYFLNSFCKVAQIRLFLTQGNSQPLPEAWQLSKAGVCQRPDLLLSYLESCTFCASNTHKLRDGDNRAGAKCTTHLCSSAGCREKDRGILTPPKLLCGLPQPPTS